MCYGLTKLMRLPRYIFDLCYANRCSICSNDESRDDINRMLYRYSKNEKHESRALSLRYIIDLFEDRGVSMPTLASLRRHYQNHLLYFMEHRSEIPAELITEYKITHSDQFTREEDNADIDQRFEAIAEGAKIYDVFPLTGYNSQIGEGGDVLSWKQWCYKFLLVRVETSEGHKFIRMVLPKHAEDLLKLMEKYLGVLLLIARGHLKSTILQIFTLRKLCDWGLKFLYIGGSKDEVVRYTENIRTELKENPMLLLYYGYLPHPQRGDSKKGLHLRSRERDFDKDAHLTFATPPKNSTGTSKLGGHSDVIVLDDIQGEEINESETLRRKQEKWFDKNIMPMRKGRTKLIIAGTRKDADDIYNYIKWKELLPVLEKPAIIKFPNGLEEDYVLTVDPITGIEYYEGGQQEEGDPDDKDSWHYHHTEMEEEIGDGHMIHSRIMDGVVGIKGGKVFWNEFRQSIWEDRPIKYYDKYGNLDKNRMAMQELLLEKAFLEKTRDGDKKTFSFWAEYQLNPIERKGKHFKTDKAHFFSKDIWHKIVGNEGIPKYTWVDVGYTLPDSRKNQKPKKVKKGKTVFCTCAFVDPKTDACAGIFTPEQGGIYVLEIRSGNFFLKHHEPKKSLEHQIYSVNDYYSPQVICFEKNYFGEYIKGNAELDMKDVPLDSKNNELDKYVRISNGINTRLANGHYGLWLCKETLGFGRLFRQMSDFPHTTQIDEIDALESCDRLLIKKSSSALLVGNYPWMNKKNKGFGTGKNPYNTKPPLSILRSGRNILNRRPR